jgi:hypothetical protein
MMRWRALIASLGCWLGLTGFAAPAPAPRLKADPAVWRLTIDTGIIADSNVTNATDEPFIPVRSGDLVLPVPLDPAVRAHSDIGLAASVSAGVRLRVSDGMAIAADAEGYAIDYEGGRNDDVSLLLAAGPEVSWGDGQVIVQMTAFERWYGGLSVNSGLGVRARLQQQVADGERVTLLVDTRIFESEYGEDFGGTLAGAYLTYDRVLDSVTTGSLGLYARREWLGGEEYSSLELGAYGGLSRYLGPDLTGGLSAGISRVMFDDPILFLSADPREDWRFCANASLTTRQPIGWGIYPSLSYSYNRTRSSISFFDAHRHRVRLGLLRSF